MDSRYDAIVVGARCAGASTAMLLARAGMKVLAVDRDPEGKDTLSTHALMRGGVLQLHRWGLLDRIVAAGTPAIRTTTFHYGGETIPIAIKPRDGLDALYGPRRTVLDRVLVEAARASGAEVAHGARADALMRDADGRVRGVVLETADGARRGVAADIVIGADGHNSRVARLAGARVERRGTHAGAVLYGYFEGLPVDGFHWYYRPGTSIGVIPTNDGLTCVFAAMPRRRLFDRAPGGFDALYRDVLAETSAEVARAVGGAVRRGKLYPFPGLADYLRRSHGPGWALVGDAGYFRDPITAHGITDALRDAELLACAVTRGSEGALAGYQAVRDGMAAGMMDLSDAVGSYSWSLEEVKVMHLELSRLMNAEVDLIRGFDRPLGPKPARPGVCPTSLAAVAG